MWRVTEEILKSMKKLNFPISFSVNVVFVCVLSVFENINV